MGLALSVTTDGELAKKIAALRASLTYVDQDISQVVRARAFDVVANAKNLVPVSTGALARSIQAVFTAAGLSATIGSWLPYAARQEFDETLDHSVRPARLRKINTRAGKIGSVIKGTAQRNPNATFGFLRKSLYAVAPFFFDDLQGIVDRVGDGWSR